MKIYEVIRTSRFGEYSVGLFMTKYSADKFLKKCNSSKRIPTDKFRIIQRRLIF